MFTITSTSEKDIGTKAVVLGCACVIFSSLTPDEITLFKTLHPEALKETDEESGTTFSITIAEGPGHVSPEEVTYSRILSADGKATITLLLDPEMNDPIRVVKQNIGSSLKRLFAMEERLVALLPKLKEEEQELNRQITRM